MTAPSHLSPSCFPPETSQQCQFDSLPCLPGRGLSLPPLKSFFAHCFLFQLLRSTLAQRVKSLDLGFRGTSAQNQDQGKPPHWLARATLGALVSRMAALQASMFSCLELGVSTALLPDSGNLGPAFLLPGGRSCLENPF